MYGKPHSEFGRGLSFNKRKNIFYAFVGYVVSLFVDEFTRHLFYFVCDLRDIAV